MIQEFIAEVVEGGIVNQPTVSTTIKSIYISYLLIPVFTAIRIGYAFIQKSGTLKGEFRYRELIPDIVYALIIAIIVGAYVPSIRLVHNMMSGITAAYYDTSIDYNKLKEAQRSLSSFDYKKPGEDMDDELMESEKSGMAEGWALSLFHWIFQILGSLIGALVMLVAFILIQFCIVVGPVALSFSIIPGFQSQVSVWVRGLFGSYAILIVLAILNNLMTKYGHFSNLLKHTDNTYLGELAQIFFGLLNIVLYLTAFSLSKYVIGDNIGGAAAANIMRAVETAAGYGSKFLGGGKGGGAGKIPNIGTLAGSKDAGEAAGMAADATSGEGASPYAYVGDGQGRKE